MLDHHQGHGGSGDAPGAGGPWLAGVDTAGVPGSPTAPLGFASQPQAGSQRITMVLTCTSSTGAPPASAPPARPVRRAAIKQKQQQQ
mmetsp:Transcript_27790/g.57012  ORF Transcript_27790/g.57012 Transcript_27790/m.57012 type:complete len:87 (+) Transcript_27790:99-359(+)